MPFSFYRPNYYKCRYGGQSNFACGPSQPTFESRWSSAAAGQETEDSTGAPMFGEKKARKSALLDAPVVDKTW